MLNSIAVIAAATALSTGSANASSQLLPAQAAWWERVDVTLSEDGAARGCEFTASHSRAQDCDVVSKASMTEAASPANAQLTKMTIERRFTPGERVPGTVETDIGDALIAASLLELTIDSDGSVAECRMVGQAGDSAPGFGCTDARAERYAPTAGGSHGYMTIAISAHREQIV